MVEVTQEAAPETNTKDVMMEEETPLEDQIEELQDLMKTVSAVKASPKGKLQQEAWEQELKVPRERQKQARPLAARLQAATDRQAKSNKDLIEANAAAEELKVKLAAAEKQIEEIKVKVAEEDAAVAACREEAAMG